MVTLKTKNINHFSKEKKGIMQALLYPGDLLTGDSNGNIFVWGRGYNAVTKAIWAAHEGPVFGLCVTRDGCVVTGGGKDGRIVVYDAAYKRTGEEATLPRNWGAVRTISQGRRPQNLFNTRIYLYLYVN
jgi:microtubule-associated protein-like 1/2